MTRHPRVWKVAPPGLDHVALSKPETKAERYARLVAEAEARQRERLRDPVEHEALRRMIRQGDPALPAGDTRLRAKRGALALALSEPRQERRGEPKLRGRPPGSSTRGLLSIFAKPAYARRLGLDPASIAAFARSVIRIEHPDWPQSRCDDAARALAGRLRAARAVARR